MNKDSMLKALAGLDVRLKQSAKLLLGGGGAMVLAYGFPLATQDLDALFYKSAVTEADVADDVHAVATEVGVPKDWLNSYFQTFLYTLPKDYETRLKTVFTGKRLQVLALGLTDLLILKCFAGREKDIPHVRALIKKGADAEFARRHILSLRERSIPKADAAVDFLDDLLDELES
jgi:hypothetical protein